LAAYNAVRAAPCEPAPFVPPHRRLVRGVEECEVSAAGEMVRHELRRHGRGDSSPPLVRTRHDTDDLGRALQRMRYARAGPLTVHPCQHADAGLRRELHPEHADRWNLALYVSAVGPPNGLKC